ncbi:hypothetical protein HAX54_005314, partial [Datura stramonium]|nr:hypothetical protein [Datura stramonium]
CRSAAVAFSPNNNRVYSIKHPTINSVMDKFLGVIPPPNTDIRNPLIKPHQNANVGEVNTKLTQMEGLIEAKQEHGETLQVMDIECPNKLPQCLSQFLKSKIVEFFDNYVVICDECNKLLAKKALEEGVYLYLKKPFEEEIVKYLWQF